MSFQPRRAVLAATLMLCSHAALAADAGPAPAESFAFLDGDWRVHHRRLDQPLSGRESWTESEGRVRFTTLLDGLASVEEMRDAEGKPFGAALRTFDRKTRLWADSWVSARDGVLQPPAYGRFDGDVGTWTSKDSFQGKPILARGTWRRVSTDVAGWEQAFSRDGGKTWETNWVMRFERIEPAAARLQDLFRDSDEAMLRLNPQAALFRGDLRYAGAFGDLISDAWLAESEAQARRELERIRAVDRSRLSSADRIAYDTFLYQTDFAVRSFEAGVSRLLQDMPLDHLNGQHVTFPQLSSGQQAAPYATLADYDAGLQRIDGFVLYLDRAREMMARGIRNRHVQTRVISERMLAQVDDFLKLPLADNPFYQPVVNFPAGLAAGERRRLDGAYRQAIEKQVVPAYRRLQAFLRDAYVPASRSGAPGLSSLADGDRLYANLLEQFTTTTLTADQIHHLGLAEVARINRKVEETMGKVGFHGSRAQFFAHLKDDPKFKFATSDELLAAYRAIGARVDRLLPTLFAATPKSPLEISYVPELQESSAGGAYYIIGAPDGSRPGTFYFNASNLPTRTSPRMTAIYLHEGLPGHHLQGSLAQEDQSLPAFLRFQWNSGYVEGWGLYSEWLGEEMGLYDDPYQYVGRLDMEVFRASRLVVDTGLHAKGWSREQAIAYMLDNTALDRAAVEQEVDRYIVAPGQATSYKVGELTLRRLRRDAEAALGAKFDVREFHQQVLGMGALPLAVLEKKIGEWIAARKAAP